MPLRLVSLLLLLTTLVTAQTVTISEPISIRSDMTYDIIGRMNGNTLVFRDKMNSWEVQCFNERLELSWNQEIELDKRRPDVIGIVPHPADDQFTVLYSKRDHGEVIIKAHRYDAAANLQDSTRLFSLGKVFYTPSLRLVYSEDRSKALVYFVENNRDVTAISLDLVNQSFLWTHKMRPERMEYPRDWRQLLVDNDGDMHLVLERDNRRSQREKHHYQVFRYGLNSGKMMKIFEVPLEGKLTYDVYFDYDNLNDQLVAGGLWANENPARSEGYFYLRVDPWKPDNPLLTFHDFNDEFVADLIEKSPEKAAKGLTDARVQQVVLRRDGGLLILGERVRVFERAGSRTARNIGGVPGPRYITDHYYEDLFVISVHPDGREHWRKVLHKKQYSQDDNAIFSSFFLAKTPSALRLLFNDDIQPETAVSEYIIGAGGMTDRNAVFSTEDQNLRLRFRDAVQIAANELVVPSERRSRLRLVRVRY